ncbi:sensor histidine kinase [Roseococcus sp. YIM B11640]|uniref:sensor histidine kinase n=1 Tax=Roseococcus sp. YIM B11640 TaxID=3133973 RepID=UPI003C7E74BC
MPDTIPAARPDWREEDRLSALRSYDILDTPPEKTFDDFVKIAAEICHTPMALVTLIDEGRQWFKAKLGLPIDETPRDVSVCSHAIRQNQDLFIVPDLATDPRFQQFPAVADVPHLRFYGGAVLATDEGLPLGTVCVLDDRPRPEGLTETQERALASLARQVMAQFELRRALRERDEALREKDILMKEIHHRVKNSLSAVQTLLTMQAELSAFPAAADELRESAARVSTFSAMHEQLYRTGAKGDVDLAAYLRQLVQEQARSHSGAAGRAVRFQGLPLEWPASEAPTLGLILVELLTNAFKYGRGAVTTSLEPVEDGVRMRVEDEGQLPADFDPAHSKGFGMSIVQGLLETQGRGGLEVDRSRPSTSLTVTLKRSAAA